MTTGEFLRAYRALLGLKQRAIANAMGVTQGYISRLERGSGDISIQQFKKLKRLARGRGEMKAQARRLEQEFIDSD